MTVAYVSQLHGARCRISAGPASKRSLPQTDACDDDGQFFSSSSSEEDYRAGYSECLLHVQRFLADQTAVLGGDVALPQLLMNHLSRFIVDAAAGSPTDRDMDTQPPQLSVGRDGLSRSSSLRRDDQLMADHARRSAVSPLQRTALFIVPPCIQPSTDTASFLLYSCLLYTSPSPRDS